MASFEDYDEFGNYIGADLDSDDEDEQPQNRFQSQQEVPSAPAPLHGFDEDTSMQEAEDNALMEIDGRLVLLLIPRRRTWLILCRAFSYGSHSTRRQAILPLCVGCVRGRCRDPRARGRRSASLRADNCAYQG